MQEGKYHGREEVAEWKLKDPNAKYRAYLLENGIATEAELVKLEDLQKPSLMMRLSLQKNHHLQNQK